MKLNVKVIGTGGIGLCVLPTLARLLNFGSSAYPFTDASLSLIDGDTFEERNKPRQGFRARGNKAEVWIKENEIHYPNLLLRAHPAYIDDGNIGMFIQEGDYVFLCVDNHKTRRLVSLYCDEDLDNINLISGGNDKYDGNVMVFIKREGRNLTLPLHATTAPNGQVYHPEIFNPPAGDFHPNETQEREGCLEQQADDPQLLIANNSAAAHMLEAFHGLLTGTFTGGPQSLFKYDDLHFDIRSGTAKTYNHSGS